MTEFKIYNPSNELLLSILVDDDSYRLTEIMGANDLRLNFSLDYFVNIPEGSYCDYKAERYWLPVSQNYVKEHTEKFVYRLGMEGSICLLKRVKFKFFDSLPNPSQGGAIIATSSFTLKFPITATPRMAADLLVANLKLQYPQYPWTVGNCIDSEPVTLDFNHDFCFDVLPKLAEAFATEWELDKYTLNIGKVEKMKDSAIDLQYGYNKGVKGGIERLQLDSKRIINRVYVEGGDRNIDRSTYGNATLLLPKNKKITYEGVEYTTDTSGSYLERVLPLAGAEDSLDITKHYPKRVGTVSAVEKIDDAKGFYNILDSSIPATLDFSKHIIAGETMTLIFQTGQLTGKEFDVKYIHDKRKFELVPINENGLIYPQGHIIPAVGDTYAVFHMDMPPEYITLAEEEALQEVAKYLWENEQSQYSYRWSLDGNYAKRNWGEIRGFLNCGFFVKFQDPQFLPEPVDVRIVIVKEFVNDPHRPEITIANNISSKSFGSILNQIPTQEQATERKDKEVVSYAKRNFKQSAELIAMLQGAIEGFTEGINPVTVQTMAMLVGDESLQFRFVNKPQEPIVIADPVYYETGASTLYCNPCWLQHMTMGIDSLSPTHELSDYKFWQMARYVSPVLTEDDTPYYLYAKCSKSPSGDAGGTGTFLISDKPIKMEQVAGYYHFLMGIISSEKDNWRSYENLYGFTEILPGRITVDKIVSSDGNNFLDLVRNALKLGTPSNGMDYNVTEKDTLTLTNATIRNALNVYGEAFIAGFLFSNQVIKSQSKIGDLHAMVLDGLNGSLQFNNTVSRWTESNGEEIREQFIRIDSSNDGKVEARNDDGDSAYMSSQGVYANRAGLDFLPAVAGAQMKASIVGLGRGKMDKGAWGENWGFVGVYGDAYNSSANPAPAYGGWFNTLKANGLVLSTKVLEGSTGSTTLAKTTTLVISAASGLHTITLPKDAYTGTTIFFKQWNTGYMRITPPSGQKLYDDSSENPSFDITEGQMGMMIFVERYETGTGNDVSVWLASKFKF